MGITLLCFYGIVSIGRLLSVEFGEYQRTVKGFEDPWSEKLISANEQRFQELKFPLPSRGVVGFITDATEPTDRYKKFFLTQYFLVPLVVIEDDGTVPIVIGIFGNSISGREGFLQTWNLHVQAAYGNGIVLLRRGEHAH